MVGLTPSAAIALAVAGTLIVVGNLIFYAMLGQVNARLPESERLSYVGFHFLKNRRIFKLYRQFFPNGRLLLAYRICVAVVILSMIMVAILDSGS